MPQPGGAILCLVDLFTKPANTGTQWQGYAPNFHALSVSSLCGGRLYTVETIDTLTCVLVVIWSSRLTPDAGPEHVTSAEQPAAAAGATHAAALPAAGPASLGTLLAPFTPYSGWVPPSDDSDAEGAVRPSENPCVPACMLHRTCTQGATGQQRHHRAQA